MALGQALWSLLNQRSKPELREPEDGTELVVGGPSDVGVNFRFRSTVQRTGTFVCSTGQSFPAGEPELQGFGATGFFPAIRVRINTPTAVIASSCETGANTPAVSVPVLTAIRANGDVNVIASVGSGGIQRNQGSEFTLVTRFQDFQQLNPGTGTWESLAQPVTPELPEQVRPRVPAPVAPSVAPAPAPVPALPQVAPVPAEAQPLPVPVPVPGGLPGGKPSRPPLVRPGPTVTPGGGTSTGQAAPQPITAGGVRPQLPPAPGTTATGTTVMPGGQQLAPNGPRPTPQAMATELGKLEQKLELALAPDGPLSLLELLNKVIDQVENIEFLIERLFPQGPYEFPAGAYQLAPICDRDSEGELVPPLQAPWTGGEGELTELRQKLDALAQLIQHHKTLKQPTCGGRGSGPASNVTVHFESD